jgi:hypothetical protein
MESSTVPTDSRHTNDESRIFNPEENGRKEGESSK